MPTSHPDSTHAQSLPHLVESKHGQRSSDLELEVIGLFDRYRSQLLAYVSAFGITGHDGEEVVQEVFLSLFCHLRQGKSRSNLRGWIFRVAHNLALKQRHRNRRSLERREPAGDAEAAPDLNLNPEEQLLTVQRQRRLVAAVNNLPERDRLCFCLRAEGLRYREIAEALGISLGAVSMSLARSLARLIRADER